MPYKRRCSPSLIACVFMICLCERLVMSVLAHWGFHASSIFRSSSFRKSVIRRVIAYVPPCFVSEMMDYAYYLSYELGLVGQKWFKNSNSNLEIIRWARSPSPLPGHLDLWDDRENSGPSIDRGILLSPCFRGRLTKEFVRSYMGRSF